MLVITGTGRSGTSLVAKFLKKCGVLDYEAEWVEQFNSGLDHPEASRINKAIWQGNDPYYYSVEAQTQSIKTIPNKIIKETNFFNGHVLDTWLGARNDLKFLICLRKFTAVQKSRKYYQQLLQLKSPEALENEFGRFLSKLVFKKIPYEIVCFPNIIEDYDTVYKKLKSLEPNIDINWATGKKYWEEIADKTMVHF